MNQEFKELYKTRKSFFLLEQLDEILHASLGEQPNEKVWSKMAMYYIGDRSIILALFDDHVNIVSNPAITKKAIVFPNAISYYLEELKDYKITPKGMLQIFCGQAIPSDTLTKIFKSTFNQ